MVHGRFLAVEGHHTAFRRKAHDLIAVHISNKVRLVKGQIHEAEGLRLFSADGGLAHGVVAGVVCNHDSHMDRLVHRYINAIAPNLVEGVNARTFIILEPANVPPEEFAVDTQDHAVCNKCLIRRLELEVHRLAVHPFCLKICNLRRRQVHPHRHGNRLPSSILPDLGTNANGVIPLGHNFIGAGGLVVTHTVPERSAPVVRHQHAVGLRDG